MVCCYLAVFANFNKYSDNSSLSEPAFPPQLKQLTLGETPAITAVRSAKLGGGGAIKHI